LSSPASPARLLHSGAERAALLRLSALEPLEQARRQAARRAELRDADPLDRARHRLHADFGSGTWDGGPIGIPFDVVTRTTPRAKVSFEYADESDQRRLSDSEARPRRVRQRPPRAARRPDACRLYELGGLTRSGGGWHAWAGATWSLRSNRVRPATWTSADAAGLPIFPGLARWDEAKRGVIDHALRFTAARTRRAFIYPARHYASSRTIPRCRRWACAFA
jgi:hypothetical protein